MAKYIGTGKMAPKGTGKKVIGVGRFVTRKPILVPKNKIRTTA